MLAVAVQTVLDTRLGLRGFVLFVFQKRHASHYYDEKHHRLCWPTEDTQDDHAQVS